MAACTGGHDHEQDCEDRGSSLHFQKNVSIFNVIASKDTPLSVLARSIEIRPAVMSVADELD